jgi:hypothetical protein
VQQGKKIMFEHGTNALTICGSRLFTNFVKGFGRQTGIAVPDSA